MEAPLVELRQADVILSGRRVLSGVNFALDAGTNWAVFGANGSGKTTLLRLVAGQQWPAPAAHEARRYDFGHGPEKHAVNALKCMRLVGPELHDRYPRRRWNQTVATVIATGVQDSPILRIRLDQKQHGRIMRLAKKLEITGLLERRFLHLSRGQQRKVLLARALIGRPRVLLLDEICDGLDSRTRKAMLAFLDEQCTRGLQLVFATHRRSELPAALDHFVELSGGRVVATGRLLKTGRPVPPPRSRPEPEADRDRAAGPLIVIRSASLYRGDTRVLAGVEWTLQPDQHWLVSGANGSGKSTFLKTLYGDLRPARGGRITWFGGPPRVNIWQVRRRIGMVSDELQSIYGDRLTAADCVATGFNASVGRVPALSTAEHDALHWAVQACRLESFRNDGVQCLSYGQFRRVLLARALVQRPCILLLDEPMSGLDANGSALIWQRVLELVAQGTQVVMATHERNLGADLFTHELHLEQGRAQVRQRSPG